ncbi:PD-(D/E)XK nuclease family protein [Pontibacter sp. KCTC 32443]|uniref:PDDEXK-like family protein n=1 Tax=Pontibacter TaxID=323449 RepID=UPI00164D4784|nr:MULTISPECIES: PD-(D/E)XK nuclease family protein [Pontibacter]MBC5772792.1 PD-(D/E)XK nuclease family protein [Pontibacter sp. KCTC 32443]
MKTLLEKVEDISHKYSTQAEKGINLFSLLRSHSDEVHLHSKFIAELLNPNGSHGQGRLFLDKFIQLCGGNVVDFASPNIKREYRKIDILVRSGSNAIVVENKIWAPDQERQLERYHNTMIAEGATPLLVYLTVDGRTPDEYTRGALSKDEIKTISYKEDILKWIEDCKQEVTNVPYLHETLQQYENIIRKITGTTMNDKETDEVIELLKQEDHILNAAKIVESWNKVKIQAEWNFWKELCHLIELDMPGSILETRKVSWEKVKDVVKKKKKGNPWYGIMLKLGENGNDQICLFIQRGIGDLYYGITVLGNGEDRDASGTSKYAALAQSISRLNDTQQEKRWLGKKVFSDPINFKQFNNPNTLKLIKPEFRHGYVGKLWLEIKEYIAACEVEAFIETTPA